MPDCTVCTHSNTLHSADGTCNIAGCSCDRLVLPEIAPDVQPPKPGACMHIMGEGSLWIVEEVAEIEEKLEQSASFVSFTGCDFEGKTYCTFPVRVRPQFVGSFHGFVDELWARVLEEL